MQFIFIKTLTRNKMYMDKVHEWKNIV